MMAGPIVSVFATVAVLLNVAFAADDQQKICQQQVKNFVQCMIQQNATASKNSNFKNEMEKCFVNAGCSVPPLPPSQASQTGPGGRAGPKANSQFTICFKSSQQQVAEKFTNCMKQKNPNLNLPNLPPLPPPPSGPLSSPVPPQQSHLHIGPLALPSLFGPVQLPTSASPHGLAINLVAQQCENDQGKAQQVMECMQTVINNNKPSKEEVKEQYENVCRAENVCKANLTTECQEKLRQEAKNACYCSEEMKPEIDEALKEYASCTGMHLPEKKDEKRDCSQTRKNPCEEGFDAFFDKVSRVMDTISAGISNAPSDSNSSTPAATESSLTSTSSTTINTSTGTTSTSKTGKKSNESKGKEKITVNANVATH